MKTSEFLKGEKHFTAFDVWVARKFFGPPTGFVMKVFHYPGAVFCYEGNCDNCGAPERDFYMPILAKMVAMETDTKIIFLRKYVRVCPGCQRPSMFISIFKSYDATREFNSIKKEVSK